MKATLAQRLEAFHHAFLQRLPAGEREAIEAHARQEHAAPPLPILQPGARAPLFSLPDQHGRMVHLKQLLGLGPVVLLFVRGGWCPFCTLTLRAYQERLSTIQQLGADLVAVTPQPAGSCAGIAERDLLAFPTLSDQDNVVAAQYGIVTEVGLPLRPLHLRLGHDLPRLNGTGTWQIPAPATFVVGMDGLVHAADARRLPYERLEPEATIQTLRALPVEATQRADA